MGHEKHVSLDVKIEVLRVQMQGVEKSVIEGREETRRWREEMMASALVSQGSFEIRLSKHEVSDDHRHDEIGVAIARLENKMFESGQMCIGRIEGLEKVGIATTAVESYRRWLIGVMVGGGISVILNLLNAFKIINFTVK